MKEKLLILGLGIILALFLVRCGSTKKVKREPIRELGAEYLIQKLEANEIHYKTLSAKFKADYIVDDKKTSLSGQVRILKDSIIWISLTPAMGIEVARLYLTNDSVKLINRLEKTYLETDYSYLNTFLNNTIDFDMLQALLTGNDFSLYEDGKWKASWDEKVYKLATTERRKLKKFVKENESAYSIPIQNLWLQPETYKITHTKIEEIRDVNPRKLDVLYSAFLNFDGQLFASELFFKIKADNKIEVAVNYNKIALDKELKYPFRVSKKYKKILVN
jgi:hypothetical protein